VLAYVFWHRPGEGTPEDVYEREHLAFHRSLQRSPPVGLRGSMVVRLAQIPWMAAGGGGASEVDGPAVDAPALQPPVSGGGAGIAGGYEDWYLLADFTALGVLNEAAVGRGHRTSHDRVARHFGTGAGGLYCLVEGEPLTSPGALAGASLAVWIARAPGSSRRGLGDLLGDGMDPCHASLWRRQLVLGPAPEFCLLTSEPTSGVAHARLPAGWSAHTLEREPLFDG
jgi:hypothetical protein